MRIGIIIKDVQPKEYSKLKKRGKRKQHSIKQEKLTKRDIHELMEHSSYRRGSGGAIRQVR